MLVGGKFFPLSLKTSGLLHSYIIPIFTLCKFTWNSDSREQMKCDSSYLEPRGRSIFIPLVLTRPEICISRFVSHLNTATSMQHKFRRVFALGSNYYYFPSFFPSEKCAYNNPCRMCKFRRHKSHYIALLLSFRGPVAYEMGTRDYILVLTVL